MSALDRAWEFDREVQERAAARVQHFEQGAALFTDSLPLVYDANHIRIDSTLGELTADDAERLAGALQHGLGHRKLLLPDAGARLAAELAERRWRVTRTCVMAYEGSREREPSGAVRAEEVDVRALRGAREAAMADRRPEERRQIADYTERLATANDTRAFAAFAGGEVAAFCILFQGPGIGEIDEVTTLEKHRRKGLGTAVVEAALSASLAEGNDLTFLIADATDWPKSWYERLGFTSVGNRFEVFRTARS
jgi:ribosomal protein S18 acetylase RimI-like enzyme